MLMFDFEIRSSQIPMAGKGLFTKEKLLKSKVIIIPNQKHQIYQVHELDQFAEDSIEKISCIRWFEDFHSVDPEWSPESHLNHSFNPNCLWHLGFVFALKEISIGDELTIDYSLLLDENTVLEFCDAESGLEVRGRSWRDKMLYTSTILQNLFV